MIAEYFLDLEIIIVADKFIAHQIQDQPQADKSQADAPSPWQTQEQMNAHNEYNLIIVQMGFEKEPWFGDHATDPKVRQASYVKDFVVPFIEENYAALGSPEGRLLFGFSKSGWGAFSLIFKFDKQSAVNRNLPAGQGPGIRHRVIEHHKFVG